MTYQIELTWSPEPSFRQGIGGTFTPKTRLSAESLDDAKRKAHKILVARNARDWRYVGVDLLSILCDGESVLEYDF